MSRLCPVTTPRFGVRSLKTPLSPLLIYPHVKRKPFAK